jgi:hypothetical protein
MSTPDQPEPRARLAVGERRQVTAEAYLRLVAQTQVEWQSRAQFFYLASRAMRSIMVDSARHQLRRKRGGGLSVEETAESLGISPATVKRCWSVARTWLFQELAAGGEA